MKIKILGRIAFAVLPSPLENPDGRAVSIAEVREGLLFGAYSTWVQILWMTFGSVILFHFHEKLYFAALDTFRRHISVPCTK